MTIIVKEESSTDSDYRDSYKITIYHYDSTPTPNKTLIGFDITDPEAEDATLGRDLSFAYKAIDFFKIGYEAGKNGEKIIYESSTESEV